MGPLLSRGPLRPGAIAVVKKYHRSSLKGFSYPQPRSQRIFSSSCWNFMILDVLLPELGHPLVHERSQFYDLTSSNQRPRTTASLQDTHRQSPCSPPTQSYAASNLAVGRSAPHQHSRPVPVRDAHSDPPRSVESGSEVRGVRWVQNRETREEHAYLFTKLYHSCGK